MNHGINSLIFQTKQHSMKKKTNFQSTFCCHTSIICHCNKLETPVPPQKTVTTFQLAHITLRSQPTNRTLSHFLERKWELYFTGTWSNMSKRGGGFFVLHLAWWLTYKRHWTLWTIFQSIDLSLLPHKDTMLWIKNAHSSSLRLVCPPLLWMFSIESV